MPGLPYVYARTARCLGRDPDGSTCHERPTDGVFCAAHAHEFRCQEAAAAATRLARTRLALGDPALGGVRRWWTTTKARRLRALRRRLLAGITRAEGPAAEIVMALEGPVHVDGRDDGR
ncbi:MAG TPA: hypothetical protein VMU09_04805 [Acidimicrobiales bacterium]|nr:hypothetical protein [Acidimicrobiales bacterium]